MVEREKRVAKIPMLSPQKVEARSASAERISFAASLFLYMQGGGRASRVLPAHESVGEMDIMNK